MNYFIIRIKQVPDDPNPTNATYQQMIYKYEIVAEHSLYLRAAQEIDTIYKMEFDNRNQYVIAEDKR
jgi:hypothetical protein